MTEPEGYEPQAGDLVWLDFDPTLGREQSGRRPALVVSPVELWRTSRFILACPITSKIRPFPTSVVLPEDMGLVGEILTSHIRSLDCLSRPIAFTGLKVPEVLLRDVRYKLGLLIGL